MERGAGADERGAVPEEAPMRAAVALGRALRARGVRVSVDEELMACRALGEVDLRRRTHVYWALRACFVRHPAERLVFDPLFARFWEGLDLEARRGAEHGESDPRMPGPQQGGESLPQFRQEGRSSHLIGGEPVRASREIPTAPGKRVGEGRRRGVLAAWSPEDVRTDPVPVGFRADEIAAVRRLAAELQEVTPVRRWRRARPSRRPGRLDLGRTVRGALATDGEPLRLAWSAPGERPRRLVVVCDVSGSMERYSRSLLGSLQGAVRAGIRAEAFVVATQLTRLTGSLAGRDLARALEDARAAVPDWSGGTRLGAALAELNRVHARRGLTRGAIVVVVSDGWDRGDPEALAAEVGRLRLVCRRLVWVNPRPGGLDGQPLAVGLRAALPWVDDYVPGHDPRAAAGLAAVIAGLDPRRPTRRQRPVASPA